ncbi:hypothetical protein [Geosporobacter ferrireducens]|uniref:PepSY domain-containing protein n=1 Tax=Geosporobacter ferrireducens TaxID=1424294 RepID=A0A1D8GMM4_9FIRM|nr:hypothetical protein [Geosporobacter ferrireducens]AOT72186.1 hypothetical protein Gferi_23165 [Geosporobacter ferrireducens]MTI56076.1 hypothetical protein [Geosporobacter ferrireducens]
MKRRWWIVCILIWSISITACSNKTDLDQEMIQFDNNNEMLTQEEALDRLMTLPQIKAIVEAGKEIEIKEIHEPTEEEPIWEIVIAEKGSKVKQVYILNAFTGELLENSIGHNQDEDIEDLKADMSDTLVWVFENWQSFHYTNYDPTRLGLAFDLNFRLAYIFNNYDENVQQVEQQKITSEVKILEIKDIGMAFDEEEHTMHAQLRMIAQYQQQINGEKLVELVEVLLFSKNHLDNEEGWQITNVDMYETAQSSRNFEKLFLGFKK